MSTTKTTTTKTTTKTTKATEAKKTADTKKAMAFDEAIPVSHKKEKKETKILKEDILNLFIGWTVLPEETTNSLKNINNDELLLEWARKAIIAPINELKVRINTLEQEKIELGRQKKEREDIIIKERSEKIKAKSDAFDIINGMITQQQQ